MSALVRLVLSLMLVFPAVSALAEPLGTGDSMPALTLQAPQDPAAQQMLGVAGKPFFSLQDLTGDLVFLEIIGVYCPQCVKQAPGFRTLFNRLNKGRYKGRVTMLALAAGGNDMEVGQLLKTGQYLFPVVSDSDYAAHKLLGEPLTPYTLICRPDGEIVFAHLGVIDDIDGLYQQIKALLP